MQADARVGRISAAAGSVNPLAAHTDGSLFTKPVPGRYMEAAIAGRLFSVANQAAVATTAALATTWTGLGVCNPAGSGKNIVIHEFGWALTVIGPAAGAVGLMTSDDTGFAAALTAKAAMHGKGSSIAYCDDGATIATPALERLCGSIGTGATNLVWGIPPNLYLVDGSIILPPDRSVMTYTTTACTAAAVFFFLFEEVDE